jgi:toxin-antitoxin system PIN domain toxin
LIAVDTNVLVVASQERLPRHVEVKKALERMARGWEPWGLPIFCIAEFIRVVTHPKVFDPPTSLNRALDFVTALAATPNLRLLTPGPRFLELFRRCALEADARANLVFDAQIAAVCLENGARDLWTLDRDFSRFKELRSVVGFD